MLRRCMVLLLLYTKAFVTTTSSSCSCSSITRRFFPKCFDSNRELRDAVIAYTAGGKKKNATLAKYGSPIGNWCVGKVTDFSRVFYKKTSFNEPLTNWDTSKATDMSHMFDQAKSFNQSLKKWKVSQVTNMSFMYYGAHSFNQPLNNWNVGKVKDMNNMFNGAEQFNQPLDRWDVRQVMNMTAMFSGALVFNQNLCAWGTKLLPQCSVDSMFNNTCCRYKDPPNFEQHPEGPSCQSCILGTLSNNIEVANLYTAGDDVLVFELEETVEEHQQVTCELQVPNGDADLYVRFGGVPDLTGQNCDCGSQTKGPFDEDCTTAPAPAKTTAFVAVAGAHQNSSDLTLLCYINNLKCLAANQLCNQNDDCCGTMVCDGRRCGPCHKPGPCQFAKCTSKNKCQRDSQCCRKYTCDKKVCMRAAIIGTLRNNIEQTHLSPARDDVLVFKLKETVKAGQRVTCELEVPNGDANLFIKLGSVPDVASGDCDCASLNFGPFDEDCTTKPAPNKTTAYVAVVAAQNSFDMTLLCYINSIMCVEENQQCNTAEDCCGTLICGLAKLCVPCQRPKPCHTDEKCPSMPKPCQRHSECCRTYRCDMMVCRYTRSVCPSCIFGILRDNIEQTNLSPARDDVLVFKLEKTVEAGHQVTCDLEVPNGDADLFIKLGSVPNVAGKEFDCNSTVLGNYDEDCTTKPAPTNTTAYVAVVAAQNSFGMTLLCYINSKNCVEENQPCNETEDCCGTLVCFGNKTVANRCVPCAKDRPCPTARCANSNKACQSPGQCCRKYTCDNHVCKRN